MATPQAQDPRAAIWRPGDSWVSIGRPFTGVGAIKVRMNQEYLFVEKGTLRTDSQQIPLSLIVDVDAKQTMTQKARGVGSVFVHVHRPSGAREVAILDDLPDFRDAVARINDASRQARFHAHTMQNTRHINYQGFRRRRLFSLLRRRRSPPLLVLLRTRSLPRLSGSTNCATKASSPATTSTRRR